MSVDEREVKTSHSGRRGGWTPAPELLDHFLSLMRVVPPDRELPVISEDNLWLFKEYPYKLTFRVASFGDGSIEGILSELDRRRASNDFPTATQHLMFVRKLINDFPFPLRTFLTSQVQGGDEYLQLKQLINAYMEFRDLRLKLRAISSIAQPQNLGKKDLVFFRLPFYSFAGSSPIVGSLSITAEGRFKVVLDPLSLELDGVDATRIRECQACKHIFWAGRRDMQGCSAKCSHVLRTAKWRDKMTEEQRITYKLARIKKQGGNQGS